MGGEGDISNRYEYFFKIFLLVSIFIFAPTPLTFLMVRPLSGPTQLPYKQSKQETWSKCKLTVFDRYAGYPFFGHITE